MLCGIPNVLIIQDKSSLFWMLVTVALEFSTVLNLGDTWRISTKAQMFLMVGMAVSRHVLLFLHVRDCLVRCRKVQLLMKDDDV